MSEITPKIGMESATRAMEKEFPKLTHISSRARSTVSQRGKYMVTTFMEKMVLEKS